MSNEISTEFVGVVTVVVFDAVFGVGVAVFGAFRTVFEVVEVVDVFESSSFLSSSSFDVDWSFLSLSALSSVPLPAQATVCHSCWILDCRI